jgi:hypothetical protein
VVETGDSTIGSGMTSTGRKPAGSADTASLVVALCVR